MKALIYMQKKDYGWLKDHFADTHPAMVQIANKPILEYLVDFAIVNGCEDIRFVLEEASEDVRDHFVDGRRWGIDISYSNSMEGDSLDDILDKNRGYCQKDPLLIINGLFFIHYDKSINYTKWHGVSPSALAVHCAGGTIIYSNSREQLKNISTVTSEVDFALSPLQSLTDLYDLTLQILDAEQDHYVLPGYSKQKGVLLGRNVDIDKEVTIIAPAIIGDNVKIFGKAVIGPQAAIACNVVIDDNTTVQQSIIMPTSYLGRNLTINQKIVSGNHLYSATDKEWVELTDNILLASLKSTIALPTGRDLANRLGALVLLLLSFIPFTLLTVVRKISRHHKGEDTTYLQSSKGDTFSCHEINLESTANPKLTDRLLVSLSLNRFQLLPKVIVGKLLLVGNKPIPVSPFNNRQLKDFPQYRPGIFTYSEAANVEPGAFEEEIAERFFSANNSLLSDCKMVCRILLNNLKSISK